jgi:hypothetical protein
MLTPDVISEIRSKLERYHTGYCGLKHERVVEFSSAEDGSPVKRYGLCDSQTRKYQLGCAHTIANYEFCRTILSMSEHLPDAQRLAAEFDGLFLNVYMMDVVMGALEKQLGLALSAGNDQLITGAKAAVAEVRATHHQLVKTIEELRREFMESLLSIKKI